MARKLCHKTGGICSHSKMADRGRPVRSLCLTGQTGLVKVLKNVKWTSPLRISRRDNQSAYVERPIWTPDEIDMASGSFAPQQTGQIGLQEWSDWSRQFRPS